MASPNLVCRLGIIINSAPSQVFWFIWEVTVLSPKDRNGLAPADHFDLLPHLALYTPAPLNMFSWTLSPLDFPTNLFWDNYSAPLPTPREQTLVNASALTYPHLQHRLGALPPSLCAVLQLLSRLTPLNSQRQGICHIPSMWHIADKYLLNKWAWVQWFTL